MSLPYRIISLYSGSSGNAFLILTPGARILIDAGKSAKTLVNALSAVGVDVDTLDAILITHDHRDHTSALPVLLSHHPIPTHIVEASAQAITLGCEGEWTSCLQRHPPLYGVTVGDVRVRSFITPHDSCFSVGYRIEVTDKEGDVHAIGYATDLGYVTPEVRQALLGCESAVLESNHDYQMLLCGPYPRRLKERILSRYGHLSNEDASTLIAELADSGTRRIMLAHLSEQNNEPDLAYNEALMALGGCDVSVFVAAPDRAVEMTYQDGEERSEIC